VHGPPIMTLPPSSRELGPPDYAVTQCPALPCAGWRGSGMQASTTFSREVPCLPQPHCQHGPRRPHPRLPSKASNGCAAERGPPGGCSPMRKLRDRSHVTRPGWLVVGSSRFAVSHTFHWVPCGVWPSGESRISVVGDVLPIRYVRCTAPYGLCSWLEPLSFSSQ
jgi:hypothetical protein